MKKSLMLFVVTLTYLSVYSQSYIGRNVSDVIMHNDDSRYDVNKFISVGMVNDSLSADFFYAKDSLCGNIGTIIYYNSKTLVIQIQSFIFNVNNKKGVMDQFIYLSQKGYYVLYKEIENNKCYLEARRW